MEVERGTVLAIFNVLDALTNGRMISPIDIRQGRDKLRAILETPSQSLAAELASAGTSGYLTVAPPPARGEGDPM